MTGGRGHDLAMALRGAYLALHRSTGVALGDIGSTADQFVLLSALHRHGPMTQRELVERTRSDPSTIRAMLVLLERKGHVKRRRHATDGRARIVTLTESGTKAFLGAAQATQPIRDCMFERLDPSASDRLIEVLNGLRDALERARSEMANPATTLEGARRKH